MHICHVIDSLAPGGAERMLVDIANATVAHAGDRFTVSVCITRSRHELAADLRPEIPWCALERQQRFELGAMRRLSRWLREMQADLLHVHSRSTVALLVALKLIGAVRQPILMHDHYGNIEWDVRRPLWFRLVGRWMITEYVGVYEKLADWAKSAGVPRDRVGVIANAMSLTRLARACAIDLRRELEIEAHRRIGLVICGLRRDKGVELLLDAFAACTRRDSAVLVIAGGDREPGYGQICRQRCRELGLSRDVFFLDERDDVPALLAAADFGIVPSRTESGPLVLIEMMAAGLPFVATLTGEIARRTAERGVPGFVRRDSAEALRDGLDQLLAVDHDRLIERGAAGREVARQAFDIDRTIDEWLAVYERIAEQIAGRDK